MSRDKGTKSLELRAALSLARLHHARDRDAEARELLAPVYAWFTEGLQTRDLVDAKELLNQIG
jgi:predicted ATPase